MPYQDTSPLLDSTVTVYVPAVGTPAGGIKGYVPVTVKGRLIQAGIVPGSLVTSTLTMAVAVGGLASSTFANVITSTIGSFSSALSYEGANLTAIPPSPVYVSPGDSVQFTFSGGQSSTVNGTAFAVVRRG